MSKSDDETFHSCALAAFSVTDETEGRPPISVVDVLAFASWLPSDADSWELYRVKLINPDVGDDYQVNCICGDTREEVIAIARRLAHSFGERYKVTPINDLSGHWWRSVDDSLWVDDPTGAA